MKLDLAAPENADLDCRSPIDIGSQSGSPNTEFNEAAAVTVEEAIASMPVPFEWVRANLSAGELAQLATMPPRLIQATVAGLFMTDNIDALSAG